VASSRTSDENSTDAVPDVMGTESRASVTPSRKALVTEPCRYGAGPESMALTILAVTPVRRTNQRASGTQ
jgi:hypothetical protein